MEVPRTLPDLPEIRDEASIIDYVIKLMYRVKPPLRSREPFLEEEADRMIKGHNWCGLGETDASMIIYSDRHSWRDMDAAFIYWLATDSYLIVHVRKSISIFRVRFEGLCKWLRGLSIASITLPRDYELSEKSEFDGEKSGIIDFIRDGNIKMLNV